VYGITAVSSGWRSITAFVVEDRQQGGPLTRTLLAYAEADLNAKAAAETLLIHVNTAHYRLAASGDVGTVRALADELELIGFDPRGAGVSQRPRLPMRMGTLAAVVDSYWTSWGWTASTC
jgi:hypothetical protein